MLKQIKYSIPFALAILISFGTNCVFAAKSAESLDRIVAVVNDTVITQSELSESMQTIKKQLQSSNVSLPPQTAFRKQVLEQLINKKLQMQLAEQMGVNITDTDVDKAIAMIAENNKLPIKELYEKVAESGMNLKDYRKQIHDELLLQQVQQQAVASKINITPQEVNDYMHSKAWQAYNTKEYHLEDILIALPETPTPQEVAAAKKRAETLIAKIKSGLDFKEAAVAESGETNALQGGDLGWRKLPEIPSAFATGLVNLQVHDLLGPIQTPNGYHILRLEGVRSLSEHTTLAQQRDQVQRLIFQRKFEDGLQSWTTKIRSEAFINTNPES
ncbi:MAG: SurA N-terminal domain-containing protein [Gammaproteobacteria bacterium]